MADIRSGTQETPDEVEAGIHACVRAFYEVARHDEVIGPIFEARVADWDAHLSLMDDFWSRAVLGTERYTNAPLPPHVPMALRQAHFDRWQRLWEAAARTHLPPHAAARAIAVGGHMAHCWGHALEGLAVARAARTLAEAQG